MRARFNVMDKLMWHNKIKAILHFAHLYAAIPSNKGFINVMNIQCIFVTE